MIVSKTIDELVITVGTPIAITGIFKLSLDNSDRLLPIPLPGSIPVLVIWIVFWSRSTLLAASESIMIKRSGFIFSITPSIISFDSIPVFPKTLGSNIEMFLYFKSTSPILYKCLVTVIFFKVS